MTNRIDKTTEVDSNSSVHTLSPRVNVRESDMAVFIEAEMPGVAADSVDIELLDGRLHILGRVVPTTFNDMTLAHREYSLTAYERTFRVSDKIEPGSIVATMRNGLLELELRKRKKAKPKRIKVKAA